MNQFSANSSVDVSSDFGAFLKCGDCGKDFKVIEQEAVFYKRKGLPNPEMCPSCRRKRRLSLRNERNLFKRKCDKCGEGIVSTYREDSPYKVYCQKCFWEYLG